MIKEVNMYTVICDNCGKDSCEGQDYSCWGTGGDALDIAVDSGWTEYEDKHYCEDCYTYDDDDKLIINTARTNLYVNK